MNSITKISCDMAFDARVLYGTLRELEDLLLTIPFYPTKIYLKEQVEIEKKQIQEDIIKWWLQVGVVTGKTFSNNAIVRFDTATIID